MRHQERTGEREDLVKALAVHREGVVRRDVAPTNVLIRADNSVAIGDFVLAVPSRAARLNDAR